MRKIYDCALLASLVTACFGFYGSSLAATPTSASYVGRVCTGYYHVTHGKYAGIYGFAYKIVDEKTTQYADLGAFKPEELPPEKVRGVLAARGTTLSTRVVASGTKFWFVMHTKNSHISFVATPESPNTLKMRRLIDGRDVGTPPATATCFAQ